MNAMKKYFGILGLVLAMFVTTAANAQSPNGLEGKARGALASCINQYTPYYGVVLSGAPVNCVTEPCPYDYAVTAAGCPVCPGDQICPAGPCILFGTVFFKDGKIVEVNSICDNQ